MARYKPQDRNSLLLPVVLSEQIVPGGFAFALKYLVDNELDLKPLDARFKNDKQAPVSYQSLLNLYLRDCLADSRKVQINLPQAA